jgi:glycosyltransferase involved in cell wall biosynthesis
LTLSIIIPAHDAAEDVEACCASVLRALEQCCDPRVECVLVDDGSADNSSRIAQNCGLRVISNGSRKGASHARNTGVEQTTGDLLLFIDSDCCLHEDGIRRVVEAFRCDPSLDAIVGSYDDHPADPHFVSQFRNLLHCYTHRVARRDASTFWTGCGAVRRQEFLRAGAFDESIHYMEDIEFGMRLKKTGARIRFDPGLQVQHRKRWTLAQMIRTDIFGRALPWMTILLRAGVLPDDLNLRRSQRVSGFLTALLPMSLVIGVWNALAAWTGLILFIAIVVLNRDFYAFLARVRSLPFALLSIPLHIVYFLCAVTGAGLALARAAAERLR